MQYFVHISFLQDKTSDVMLKHHRGQMQSLGIHILEEGNFWEPRLCLAKINITKLFHFVTASVCDNKMCSVFM